MPKEIIINSRNAHLFVEDKVIDGERKARGLMPRSFATHPVGYGAYAPAFDIPLIPESEWQDRLDEQIKNKAQLSDIRNTGMGGKPIPSRDQNGKGYCLTAETPIRMANTTELPIAGVRVGDWVYSHANASRRVTQIMRRRYSGLMYTLDIGLGYRDLTLTAEHPVAVGKPDSGDIAWTEAKDVRPGQRVLMPRLESLDRPSQPAGFHKHGLLPHVDTVKCFVAKDLMVYNLEVEEDNSYIANDIAVHNCWAHSSTSAALIIRALNNEPYADLSAYAVACVIKNYRDQGGWGAESLAFIAERGIPTSEFWPQKSMSRGNDNPKTWENAARHKFTEWMDLDPRDMKRQLVTCLLLGIPVVSDFNWWGHSVCSIDLVSLNPFRTRIWNSWGDSWSANGTGILEGRRAIPDAAIAPRVMTASAA
jgi:hypothetical protein